MSKTSEREAIIERLVGMLREERVLQKLSINEVATRSGLSHAMVSRVEKRQRLPTIDTLLSITGAMGVVLSKLLRKAMRNAKE